MHPKSVVFILNTFFAVGYAKHVFLAFQTHVPRIEGERVKLSPASRMGMITNGGITISEYIGLLESNQYSAVFYDGSLLYMECVFINERLNKHRYFFIPCPFVEKTITSRPDHAELADWLREQIDIDGKDIFCSKGAFRFDFSREPPHGAGDPHPLSHLTFASGACRMPVRGPLQMSSFINFLFDNFFRADRDLWLQFAGHFRLDEGEVTITDEEAQLHHLSWGTQR